MTIFLTELIVIFNKTEIYPNENTGIKISELIFDGFLVISNKKCDT